jgi:hypothetical protein
LTVMIREQLFRQRLRGQSRPPTGVHTVHNVSSSASRETRSGQSIASLKPITPIVRDDRGAFIPSASMG